MYLLGKHFSAINLLLAKPNPRTKDFPSSDVDLMGILRIASKLGTKARDNPFPFSIMSFLLLSIAAHVSQSRDLCIFAAGSNT